METLLNNRDIRAEIFSHLDLRTWINCQSVSQLFHVTSKTPLMNILTRTPFKREDYFNIVHILKHIFNKPFVLFIQIGQFTEIYGKDQEQLKHLSLLLNCLIIYGHRFSQIALKKPQLGFPTIARLDRIEILKQSNYSIMLMKPDETDIKRFYLTQLS